MAGSKSVFNVTPVQQGETSPFDVPGGTSQDLAVDASACASMSGHEAKGLEGFKKHLVEQVKQEATRLLISKLYAGKSDSPLQRKLPAEYNQSLAKRVQLLSKPTYYNGQVFGEMCVRVRAGLDKSSLSTAAPVTASLENFCYQAADLTEDDLKNKAQQAALDRIIQNVAPGAEIPFLLRTQLLDTAVVNGQLGGADGNTYCLNMSLIVAPMELESFIPGKVAEDKGPPKGTETLAQREKPAFSLDLSHLNSGDMAPDLGDNLRVYSDMDGKSLGALSQKRAMVILPVTSEQDFTLRILVKKMLTLDYKYDLNIEMFRLHFANKKFEPFAFVMYLDDNRHPVAYFQTRHDSTDVLPWENATNFNDCLVVKRGKRINFFFNGVFVFSYPTEGDTLKEVRVPLEWDERLYNVLLKNDK